ncbi:MAG: hypothetical protein HY097_04420 [Nitrospinae bacterium]|nr:hypothetical protein [Nitrospinota bacterium]MBI3815777.1 hypothetical protein [Nitrospinota bacterium]
MKKLLASIDSFISRIRQPQWFAIISLLFILPFAVVMYYQIAMLNSHIAFTRKEKMGIECIQSVIKFLKDVQQDRGMSTAFLSGDLSFRKKLEKKQAELKEDIWIIDSIDEKYGGILKTTDKWNNLKGKCQKLEAMEWGMTSEESFDAHSEPASDILSFIFHIRSASNLIIDSYFDSHYLIGITTIRIPPITENIGKIRAFGITVIVKGGVTEDEKIKLMLMRESIKPTIDVMENYMRSAFQENPDIEPLLKTYFHDAVFTTNVFMDMLNSKIINSKTIDIQTEEYFNAATIAIDANFMLYDAVSLTLDGLLQGRIERHLREKYYIIVSSAIIAAVFFYIFARFKASLTEQIRVEERLKTTVKEKEMLLKELHHRVKNNLQIISSLSSLQSEYIQFIQGNIFQYKAEYKYR